MQIMEWKWKKSNTGIMVIHLIQNPLFILLVPLKKKEYCKSLEEYQSNILLIGVNYNRKTKEHECIIVEYRK